MHVVNIIHTIGGIGMGVSLALLIMTFPTVLFVYAVRYGWVSAYKNAYQKKSS